MGVIVGASGIPAKWKDPLGDWVETYVEGFEKLKISELTKKPLMREISLIENLQKHYKNNISINLFLSNDLPMFFSIARYFLKIEVVVEFLVEYLYFLDKFA